MKIGPLRAPAFFVLVHHLWAVAMLICALWRLVRIVFTYLLILLLFFNAEKKKKHGVIRMLLTHSSVYTKRKGALTKPAEGTVSHCCHFGIQIRWRGLRSSAPEEHEAGSAMGCCP